MTVSRCLLGRAGCRVQTNPPLALTLGSRLQNLGLNAATPFHKAGERNLESAKRVKKAFGPLFRCCQVRSNAVVPHRLAALEPCGTGALWSPSRRRRCVTGARTQGLGPTSPRRVDLQRELGAVWALTVRLLHLLRLPVLRGRSQSRGSPPAVSRVAGTGAGHKVPRRCRGLLSPAGTPLRPRCARPAGLRVPAGCSAPLPRQGAQEGDDEDEDVTDELGEREGSA